MLEALPASNGPAVQVSPNFKVCGEEGRVQTAKENEITRLLNVQIHGSAGILYMLVMLSFMKQVQRVLHW